MNSKACLVDNGIKCVITMTPKKPTKVEGIVYVQFPFEDAKESDISTCFKETNEGRGDSLCAISIRRRKGIG